MDDLIADFIAETNENFEGIGADLLKLQQHKADPEAINAIFRHVHTLKGSCGFLSLPHIENIAHQTEELLVALRDGEAQQDAETTPPILQSIAQLQTLVQALETPQAAGSSDGWARYSLQVADLAEKLGKLINLEINHADILSAETTAFLTLRDPLTHLIRNACDHGIEMPEARKQANKDETGTIRLDAVRDGDVLVVSLSDDGQGVCTAEAMSDEQLQALIFTPGFSTAADVTTISGRGVGLDVVKAAIEKAGGTIEVNSQNGAGTRFVIKIPLKR